MTPATATNSMPGKGLDEPLDDPTNDLLDVDQHARALANYIRAQQDQLPFTVGIFGEWGEGKTTMVGFLRYHLDALKKNESENPIKFVSFSAWPFTTSEKLWRALILEIAKVLFNEDARATEERERIQKQAEQQRTDSDSSSWMNRLSAFLANDFFPRKEPTRALNAYEKFVSELEETDYGRISKRTPTRQVNQEAMMTAVVNGALTILGTMSPLVLGLRGLLGSKIEVPQQSQKDESSTEAVEALPRFRKIFSRMLNAKTDQGEAVYVFIDDLDRCQPDVALDIMESIRIAMPQMPCIFIIAVDETLISQGLRLRYKELFAEATRAGENEALANKGQEYLEKIIQFRTRVPPRTAEQTKRLIAAEFPDWTPAGDIIQTIANNNPRRIKQYCQRLSFQKDVGSTFILGSAGEEEGTPETHDRAGQAGTGGLGTFIPPSGPNDVVMFSRIIMDQLNPGQIAELFLLLERPYGEIPGNNTREKVESFVMQLSRDQKLIELRKAMRALKTDLRFPDED